MTTNIHLAAPQRTATQRAPAQRTDTPPDEVIVPVQAPAKQKLRFDAKGFVPAILGIFLGVALASHVPADAAHGVAAQNLLGNNGVEIASIL